MTRLTLVPVHDVTSSQPAAFHELAAAKYLGMSRTTFRSVVRAGLIPYAEHVGGKARIYLRSGLDAYLDSLRWRKMEVCEHPRETQGEK